LPTNILMRKRTLSTAGAIMASTEHNMSTSQAEANVRKRADSMVRFSDRLWTTFPTSRTDTGEDTILEMAGSTDGSYEQQQQQQQQQQHGPPPPSDRPASKARPSALKERRQSPPPPPPPPLLPKGFTNESLGSLDDWLSAGAPAQNSTSSPYMNDESERGLLRDTPSYPPPPINTVPVKRHISMVSSIDNDESFSERPLTDDEKFEREYGDLFDPEVGEIPSPLADDPTQQHFGGPVGAVVTPDERQKLLDDGTNNNYRGYSSTP